MSTLFVNACMRQGDSRTLALCRGFLADKPDVEEVNLAELGLKPFDAQMVAHRVERQEARDWDDPVFALSRQFAQAERIVIGAPYWDLSFPSALKVYLEHVSVCDLTFHYTEDARCEGLCRASELLYIMTAGGSVEGVNFGYDYLCGIAKMVGIPQTRCVAAEGLDVVGADVDAALAKAAAELAAIRW